MAEIEDGNLKGAIRLLCSEDNPAPNNESTLTQLQLRHPSAPHDRRDIPPPATFIPLQFSENDVIYAIRPFLAGSACGPDGIRPQHILVKCKESGVGMLTSILSVINLLLDGRYHPAVIPFFWRKSHSARKEVLGASAL